MPALDTNVLIRYLIQDDRQQTREASKFISQFADSEGALFLPTSVVLEMEWVLRSAYEFSKEPVIEILIGLLETREISFQDEASIERAIFLYRENNVDFADCLHVATAYTYNELPLMTFDKKATRVEGIEVIPK
jgi:predicted nucleic-acid-binding protein